MESAHDYVIVGAGSAGCAVAARLSESGDRVLLLEAGGRDRSPNIKIPAAFSKQFRTKLDWDYSTGPEPGLGGGTPPLPRGENPRGGRFAGAARFGHRRPPPLSRRAG